MKSELTIYLVGGLAGIASAILLLSAGAPSFMSIILFSCAALPIFIASLGWSNRAAITGVVIGIVVLLIVKDPMTAATGSMITLLPAAWLGHLSTLARPASEIGGPEDHMVWYPIPQLMLHITTLMALATIMIGIMIDYSPELVGQVVDAFIQVMQAQGPSFLVNQTSLDALKRTFTLLIPMMQSAMWVIILFGTWYFASKIVRFSAKSKRPEDNIPLTLRMPQLAALFLVIGLGMMFLTGSLGYIGAAITGAIGAGFMLSGLAFTHARTRGKVWQGPALFMIYLLIIFFSFPIIAFIVIGLFEIGRPVPQLISTNTPDIGADPHLNE